MSALNRPGRRSGDAIERADDEGVSLVTAAPITDDAELIDLTVESFEVDDEQQDVVVATLRPADDQSPLQIYRMLTQCDLPFVVVDG